MSSAPTPLAVRAWRDYQDEVRRLPGMFLGSASVTGAVASTAEELYASGARRIELVEAVDLSSIGVPEAVVRTLRLLQELTARGIVVDWRLRLRLGDESTATALGHLYPPREIDGCGDAARLRADWARTFFLGKCSYRHGPGFLEIRDHRSGVLQRIVIDEPEYHAAISELTADAPAHPASPDALTDSILDALATESLTLSFGGLHWWAPCRIYRWPQPPFHV
ncbi:DUF5825 family protein [Streptomyces apocyni]|uniref:DUF5825 family protein n=1 Tax=Streptomyces apocyni TaxID=2654677 RepID=UPI0012EADF10|nr:DUF5825 family protein [Streptomyces apocyni]